MSQAGILSASAMPSVPTTFTTDSGTATPAANNINILGIDSTANNANGISTSGSGSTVNVILSNRMQGTTSTVGAVTADVITLALGATPGTYIFEFRAGAFESTTPASAGYSIFGTVRTTGAAAVLVGTPDFIVNEEAALSTADIDIVVSANNAILRVTGVAALTLQWSAVGLYTLAT